MVLNRSFGWLVALALLIAIGAMPPQNVAIGQAPPGPTTAFKSTFQVANPPAQFDLVQDVLDFAPGAWTPPHVHGGQGFVTVVAGEITLLIGGSEKKYKAGETWMDTPGVVHQAGNATNANARTVVTFLLPQGAQVTTVQQMANAHPATTRPTIAEYKFQVPSPPGQFDVVEMGLDFAPGAWTPTHTHGGPAFITVLQGELTVRLNGTEKKYKVGESWVEQPGEFFQVGNAGTAQAGTYVTFLLPKGAPLTTVQSQAPAQPAGLPRTGGGADGSRAWLLLIAGVLLIAGGLVWRNRIRHV